MKLSVVIPCYNEEKNIPLILNRFNEVIKNNNIEVILVNNGSTDNSAEVIARLLPNYHFARTVSIKINQGYGYGILTGLRAASGDFLGWTHADMQTDPMDVIKAFDIIKANNFSDNLYIKGNRIGRSLFDNFFTIGMSIFESIYLGSILYEINAQPNIFARSFFCTWKEPPKDFSLDLYALYKAKKAKLNIKRFKVVFPKRIHGISSWNTGFQAKWKFIKRTVEFSRKLKKGGIR